MAMQHWFVYYKLDAATARAVEPRLHRMQQRVAGGGSVRARLLRRCDDRDGPVTLLETYDDIARPNDFAIALDAAVVQAGLPPELLAQRRMERFETP
jgi:hypothetical protein